MSRLGASLFVAAVLIQASTSPAWAQYFSPLHPTKMRPVGADQGLLVSWDDDVVDELAEIFDCEVYYVFRADAAERRRFADFENEDSIDGPVVDLAENMIIADSAPANAVEYRLKGNPVYIGVGSYIRGDDDGHGIHQDVVFSFCLDSANGNEVIPLDLIGANRWFITAVYALDLTADGLLDLACVSSWGVSGGGGVDFVTLQPDGKFRQLWQADALARRYYDPPIIESTIESSYSVCSFHDFDSDGIWEVETRQYLSYGGGSGSYTYDKLYTFDPQSGKPYGCTAEFADRYEDQRKFYEAFAQALGDCEADPAPFRKQVGDHKELAWEYEGGVYSISDFSIKSRDVLDLLQSWDDYVERD